MYIYWGVNVEFSHSISYRIINHILQSNYWFENVILLEISFPPGIMKAGVGSPSRELIQA